MIPKRSSNDRASARPTVPNMYESPADHGPTTAKRRPIGPHSRLLARGTLSGRSREGRYVAAVEAALAQHVAPAGEPSITQRLLIRRAAKALLQLELLDEKPVRTDHDLRLAASLDNRARLILRELGLKAAAPAAPTLAEVLAQGRAVTA
jgi:hypothetical protein